MSCSKIVPKWLIIDFIPKIEILNISVSLSSYAVLWAAYVRPQSAISNGLYLQFYGYLATTLLFQLDI